MQTATLHFVTNAEERTESSETGYAHLEGGEVRFGYSADDYALDAVYGEGKLTIRRTGFGAYTLTLEEGVSHDITLAEGTIAVFTRKLRVKADAHKLLVSAWYEWGDRQIRLYIRGIF